MRGFGKIMNNLVDTTPTRKPRWIMSRQDLPRGKNPQRYNIDGRKVIVSKGKRQVVDALLHGPINAASPVRLSDAVFRLKSEDGVSIDTVRPEGRPAFYRLASKVVRVGAS